MSNPLKTAGDVVRALDLYTSQFGSATPGAQERMKDFVTILRAAAVSAPEHNLYGKRFVEGLADLIEELAGIERPA